MKIVILLSLLLWRFFLQLIGCNDLRYEFSDPHLGPITRFLFLSRLLLWWALLDERTSM
jgi:hypothetical protein